MSRTTQTIITDPASKIIGWNAEKGHFIGVELATKEKFDWPLPAQFVVLDELQQVKGWSNQYETGIYSNMWKGSEPGFFKVRTNEKGGNDFPITGHWSQIKEKVLAAGGRWVKIIYAMIKNGKDFEIVKIELKGLAAYEYSRQVKNPYAGAVTVKEVSELKKLGKTFKMPVFSKVEVSDAGEAKAKQLDTELQDYLKSYFDKLTEAANVEKYAVAEAEPVPAVVKPVKEADEFIAKARKQKQEMEFGEDFTEPTDDLPF